MNHKSNYRKGFAPIVIVIILLVLASSAGAGTYFLVKQQSTNSKEETVVAKPETQPKDFQSAITKVVSETNKNSPGAKIFEIEFSNFDGYFHPDEKLLLVRKYRDIIISLHSPQTAEEVVVDTKTWQIIDSYRFSKNGIDTSEFLLDSEMLVYGPEEAIARVTSSSEYKDFIRQHPLAKLTVGRLQKFRESTNPAWMFIYSQKNNQVESKMTALVSAKDLTIIKSFTTPSTTANQINPAKTPPPVVNLNPNFTSFGEKIIEEGITANYNDAKLEDGKIKAKVTLKNTSTVSKEVMVVRMSMYSATKGTGVEKYFSVPLAPSETRELELTYAPIPGDSLYTFKYAPTDGSKPPVSLATFSTK